MQEHSAVCPRCGSQGNTPDMCPNKLCYINCGGPHSAAYQGCPQQRLRLIANRIRSGTFIPYSEALKRAHVEVEDRKKPLQLIAVSVSVSTQTVQVGPWTRNRTDNERAGKRNILARLCILSNARITPKAPPHVAQVVEPPVPPVAFETVNKQKQKDKDANFGCM